MKVGLVCTETNRWSYYEDDMWYGYTALGAVLPSARMASLSEVAEGGSAF